MTEHARIGISQLGRLNGGKRFGRKIARIHQHLDASIAAQLRDR